MSHVEDPELIFDYSLAKTYSLKDLVESNKN